MSLTPCIVQSLPAFRSVCQWHVQEFDRITGDVVCHGNAKDIKEGYKSFPSGHTSCKFNMYF